MLKGQHRIRRQRCVIRVATEREGLAARTLLRERWRSLVVAALERALDEVAPPGVVVHLPELRLDLKLGSVQALQDELPELAYQEARRTLEVLLARVGDVPAEIVSAREVPLDAQPRESLGHYLRHGSLPWSAVRETGASSDPLRRVARELLADLAVELVRERAAPEVFFRLLQLLDGASMRRMVTLVEGAAPTRGSSGDPAASGFAAPPPLPLRPDPPRLAERPARGHLSGSPRATLLALVEALLVDAVSATPSHRGLCTLASVFHALSLDVEPHRLPSVLEKLDIDVGAPRLGSVLRGLDLGLELPRPPSPSPEARSSTHAGARQDVGQPTVEAVVDPGLDHRSAQRGPTAGVSREQTGPQSSGSGGGEGRASSVSGRNDDRGLDPPAGALPPSPRASVWTPTERAVEGSRGENPRDAASAAPWDAPRRVHNAGLVLLHPFLSSFLARCGVVEPGQAALADGQVPRAAALLHFLAVGQDEPFEFELELVKVLLGRRPEDAVMVSKGLLTDRDRDEAQALMRSVIAHWSVLKNTSPAGLRSGFLQRHGLLRRRDQSWALAIEAGPVDVLIGHLPWAIAVARLPWMPEPLYTTWTDA